MQGIQPTHRPFSLDHTDGGLSSVRLELTTMSNLSPLAIDVSESTEMRIQRLISENPVVIFSRPSCCMCHVMKKLLGTLGVHPTVIELDEHEINALPHEPPEEVQEEDVMVVLEKEDGGAPGGGERGERVRRSKAVAPTVFIGGSRVGGLESLVALHVGGLLVTKLLQVGACGNGYE